MHLRYVYLIFVLFQKINDFSIFYCFSFAGTVRFLGFQEIKNMFPELRRGVNDPCVKVSSNFLHNISIKSGCFWPAIV